MARESGPPHVAKLRQICGVHLERERSAATRWTQLDRNAAAVRMQWQNDHVFRRRKITRRLRHRRQISAVGTDLPLAAGPEIDGQAEYQSGRANVGRAGGLPDKRVTERDRVRLRLGGEAVPPRGAVDLDRDQLVLHCEGGRECVSPHSVGRGEPCRIRRQRGHHEHRIHTIEPALRIEEQPVAVVIELQPRVEWLHVHRPIVPQRGTRKIEARRADPRPAVDEHLADPHVLRGAEFGGDDPQRCRRDGRLERVVGQLGRNALLPRGRHPAPVGRPQIEAVAARAVVRLRMEPDCDRIDGTGPVKRNLQRIGLTRADIERSPVAVNRELWAGILPPAGGSRGCSVRRGWESGGEQCGHAREEAGGATRQFHTSSSLSPQGGRVTEYQSCFSTWPSKQRKLAFPRSGSRESRGWRKST